MCDVRVSVFGQPDSLRTVRERLFTLHGVQVVIISILNSILLQLVTPSPQQSPPCPPTVTIAECDRRESFAEYQRLDDDKQFTEPPSPKRRRIDPDSDIKRLDSDVIIVPPPRPDSTDSDVTRLNSDITRLNSDVLIASSPRLDSTDSDATTLNSDVLIDFSPRPDSDATRLNSDVLIDSSPRLGSTDSDTTTLNSDILIVPPLGHDKLIQVILTQQSPFQIPSLYMEVMV